MSRMDKIVIFDWGGVIESHRDGEYNIRTAIVNLMKKYGCKLLDTNMNPIFTEKIKNADKNQQKVAGKSFQKRLKEFGDEVQELEEFAANLQAQENEDALKAEEKDYLEICLEACEAYNEELGDELFDEKSTD